MKIFSVKQLKDIEIEGEKPWPLSYKTRIILDKKNPSHRKEHQLIYQQFVYYGQVGDRCKYLDNSELLELEKKGFISIKESK
jgi:hypothetical protein